jgi:hypothetical protein
MLVLLKLWRVFRACTRTVFHPESSERGEFFALGAPFFMLGASSVACFLAPSERSGVIIIGRRISHWAQ